MKLNLSQIKTITTGAVKITEEADGFHFHRFTEEQEELFRARRDDFYQKTFCTAGVQLRFRTDSRSLSLKAEFFHEAARQYFAMDIFVDGKYLDSVSNFENVELPVNYTGMELPAGEYEKNYVLQAGEKEIRIYMPWSVRTVIRELTLDDGASVIPVRPKYKLLCFGDSITHGYDLLHPSCRHAAQLADFLNAEEFNKAIGGDKFFPELAKTREDFLPDYIVVAFGTNDWDCCPREFTENCCRSFYKNISQTYPDAKIFAITPIWRADMDQQREFGAFSDVEKMIRSAVVDLENVTVIRGFDFVPHDVALYADLRLHPNDAGAAYYYKNLSSRIGEVLQMAE